MGFIKKKKKNQSLIIMILLKKDICLKHQEVDRFFNHLEVLTTPKKDTNHTVATTSIHNKTWP